jgi:hypothetical protein
LNFQGLHHRQKIAHGAFTLRRQRGELPANPWGLEGFLDRRLAYFASREVIVGAPLAPEMGPLRIQIALR